MHAMGLAWCGCKISRFVFFLGLWFGLVLCVCILMAWHVSNLSVYGLVELYSILRLVGLLDGL